MTKRIKKIGTIGVDSGTIIISDPCYLIDDEWGEEDYKKEVVDNWYKLTHQIKNDVGAYKAIISETGYGDGVFPVYATIGKDEVSEEERVEKIEIYLI